MSPKRPTSPASGIVERLWPVLVWVAVWALAAHLLGQPVLLPSPLEALGRLSELVMAGEFWSSIARSLGRIALGFVLACTLGVLLAALAYACDSVRRLLAPVVGAVKAAPVASFIILVLVWVSSRDLSLVISFLMIVISSPLMLLTALIIRITSPGKIIFRQKRVGLLQRPFTMYKFRSMREETENDLSGAEKNDPRCTPFGKFIRKFSIDELPQLFNVLKGDMSLVGPRPEIPFYVKEYRKSVPLYMVKHYVKPGITGWAQVNDLRGSDTSIEERIRYDIYYIEHWSVFFDFKILLKTLGKIFFSKNAR